MLGDSPGLPKLRRRADVASGERRRPGSPSPRRRTPRVLLRRDRRSRRRSRSTPPGARRARRASTSRRAGRSRSLVTTGAITLRVDRMAAKGLVTRTPDVADRRSVKIRLTSRALELIDEILPLHLANEARLVEGLGADERSHLAATLAGLLESHGDTPANTDR
ncbi:MarR family winged helix-turn-helix transcriptional regulator [Nonomuraea sp. GTA35]|uniref:MarR family winged helix-turn-helix transcriptional regulator n=1 Tax=Nonomuraea sp. GTA35 TaxID=1676746 RepID=UPI0035BEB9E5